MTSEQIVNAYPHCKTAVAWVEVVFDTQDFNLHPQGKSAFDLLREKPHRLSLKKVVGIVQANAQGAADDADMSPCDRQTARTAVEEMGHPSFLTYLKGKLGMM